MADKVVPQEAPRHGEVLRRTRVMQTCIHVDAEERTLSRVSVEIGGGCNGEKGVVRSLLKIQ